MSIICCKGRGGAGCFRLGAALWSRFGLLCAGCAREAEEQEAEMLASTYYPGHDYVRRVEYETHLESIRMIRGEPYRPKTLEERRGCGLPYPVKFWRV